MEKNDVDLIGSMLLSLLFHHLRQLQVVDSLANSNLLEAAVECSSMVKRQAMNFPYPAGANHTNHGAFDRANTDSPLGHLLRHMPCLRCDHATKAG